MHNLTYGILTVVIAFVSYFLAWRNYKRGDVSLALFFILLSGVLCYLFTASDSFLHEWDERYHALVAKNLINHPLKPTLYDHPLLPYDYTVWISNHVWLHKQPLPLWLMAGSVKLFGPNEFAVRLPSIVMSSLGILLTYKVGGFFFNKKVGVIAAGLFSINGLIIELTSGRVATDHVDISFMFFILLSIYFTCRFIEQKKVIYIFLIGIAIGAAILTKWLTGLIVLPICLLLVLDSKSFNVRFILINFVLLLITIGIVALPWQVYIFKTFPNEAIHESNFNMRHFTEVIEERSGSIFYFIEHIRINYGELIYLPLGWMFWKLFKTPKNLKCMALFVWIVIPLVVFSIAKTKMQGYLLFTAPALFILTGAFVIELNQLRINRKVRWPYTVLALLFFVLPIRYGIERMKPFNNTERHPQWVKELKLLGEREIRKGVLFQYNRPIEAMFYTNLTVYPTIPSAETLQKLVDQGWYVLINECPDQLSDSLEMKHIECIQLLQAEDIKPENQ